MTIGNQVQSSSIQPVLQQTVQAPIRQAVTDMLQVCKLHMTSSELEKPNQLS